MRSENEKKTSFVELNICVISTIFNNHFHDKRFDIQLVIHIIYL